MVLRLAAAGFTNRNRSFRVDARSALRSAPSYLMEGAELIPPAGPFLLVINHFNHPRIPIWWPVLLLSASMPGDIHWVMTAAWTYSGWLSRKTLGPLSAWAFARIARVYGFTNIPVMPPRPGEEELRAAAVRRVMQQAQSQPRGIIGLAPEGHNTPDLSLGWPPPGSGRFLYALSRKLHRVLPVGICNDENQLVLRIGPPFEISSSSTESRPELDRLIGRQVMGHIACLLPARMRGDF